MSNHFRLVLTVRFLGYLLLITGTFGLVFTFGPLVLTEAGYRYDRIVGIKHTIPQIITSGSQDNRDQPTNFGSISSDSQLIKPASTDFGIVIEKINANSKVVPNVNPASEKEYLQALSQGVAHAGGTAYPGQKGNIYLFSHSTDAPWNAIRYNAVFYLLRELEKGDRIVMFYLGRRYDYLVYDKVIAEPNDVSYLTNTYNDSVLTLQTCDPPGTLFKRLVVRARLASS